MTGSTVVGTFLGLARSEPDVHVAMDKRFGVWHRRTRGEFAERLATTAAGLEQLGVRPGDTVLVAAVDQLEWLRLDLAVQAIGATVCAVPADTEEALLRTIVAAAAPRAVVVSEQEAVDRFLDLADAGVAPLEHIIQVRSGGVDVVRDDRVVLLDDIDERGRAAGADVVALQARVDDLDPGTVAVVAPGGLGDTVRLVELTHARLLAGTRAVIEATGLSSEDRALSYRPLADPHERTTTIYACLLSGALLALPEALAQREQAMFEVAPTYVHVPRRWLDQTAAEVTARLSANRGLKRLVTRSWVRRFTRTDGRARAGVLMRYPVVEKLGLDRARLVVVSGSPVGTSERRFAEGFGLPLRSAYALSEAGGIVTLSEGVPADPEDCGRALPGVGLSLDDAGHVEVAGEMVPGGRLVTDDLGDLDSGILRLQGRAGETVAVGGSTLALLQLETSLRRSPYVREAFVTVRDARTIVVVELVAEAVVRWASSSGVTFATFRALSQTEPVHALIRTEVETLAADRGLATVDEVRILPVGLEEIPGALTPSGRPRRDVVVAASRDDDTPRRTGDDTATAEAADAGSVAQP